MRTHRTPPVRPRFALALAGVALCVAPRPCVADDATGEQIYRTRCASCHGKSGEGTKDNYPKALLGDRSVAQLSKLIAKTMPEDDPGTCVGPEAEKVAAYIHEAFYSPLAQAKNKPARVELSRLTVRQYRNAVADLIGSFREAPKPDSRQGLRGLYYKARQPGGGTRVIDRVDPEVRFDFGVKGPEADKFEPNQFSIAWEGTVFAPDTGDYEFVVRTEHATRLYVNDPRRPVIDAWVKSGNDTEFRASLRLLGGRAYPIKLEFSKAKQGVDDSKKEKKAKPPEVKASVALLWKPPQGVLDVVPARVLSPGKAPALFVLTTPFPPDDRSVGYERGTSVSKAWEQANADAAIETAGYVVARLRELSGVSDDPSDRVEKLKAFCRTFAGRAFRRPLGDDTAKLYVDRQFEEAKDPTLAVKRVVLLTLQSPRFLYREIGGGRDPYDVASRLAFTLWDSLPDAKLTEAAAAGRLLERAQVVEQAERMLADPRAHSKVREFLLQWLRVEQAPDLSKDSAKYPEFTANVMADLRASLDLALDDVVWGDRPDFRRFLLSEDVFLNGRLSAIYGGGLKPDAPFQKVSLEAKERAGVVTHPYLMATFAYTGSSSPIHRGVFLARSVLGRSLRTPPAAVAPLAPDLHPGMTTRERVTLQTSPQACQTCHTLINPLGYTLEHFDAIGRYRSEEKGKPVDATGSYTRKDGEAVRFDGARDLANFLAASEETQTSFVEQLFHHEVKQPVRAFGPTTLSELTRMFAERHYDVRKLLVEIAAASSLPARGGNPRVGRALQSPPGA